MIKEIKDRLERGEVVELECVDRVGAFYGLSLEKTKGKLEGLLRVKEVDHNDIHFESGEFIEESELKYFRIVEAKQAFDDLIDAAIQAYKDGVIKSLKLLDYGAHSLSYSVSADVNGDENTIFSQHKDYSGGINFINSLYTETFVIESVEDINKVISRKEIGFNKKHMTVATLMNGNEILITKLDSDNTNGVVVYMRDGLYKNYLGIDVLKGATVTQKRGK